MLEYFYRQTYIHKTFPPHLFKKIKKKKKPKLFTWNI